jgi:hypothetical protein
MRRTPGPARTASHVGAEWDPPRGGMDKTRKGPVASAAPSMPLKEWPVDVALLFACCGLPILLVGLLGSSRSVETAGGILLLIALLFLVAGALAARRRPIVPR